MGLTETYLFFAVAISIALMWSGRVRPDVAGLLLGFLMALGQFCGLGLLGAAGDSEAAVLALSGLAQPVVITLFSLFVVTRSLERTGVPRSFARRVVSVGKSSHGRIIALLAANAAFLSLFMSNLAAGALVLSSAIEVSNRHQGK
jgi:di/tricarboxylate transporter